MKKKNSKQPVIYSADWCGYCVVLKNFLDSKGISYEIRDVDEPGVREEMNQRTDGNQTIPTMFIGDEFWVNPNKSIIAEKLL